MKRLEERRRARLFAELGSTMKLPRSGAGRLSLEVHELADHERPPMIRIPEYLEKRRGHRRRTATAAEPAMTPGRVRVLIAPDSFKGTLTSVEVAHGDRRRLAAGPPRRRGPRSRRSPTAARGRSSRSRRPAAGRGATPRSTTRSAAPIRGGVAGPDRRRGRVRRDGDGVRAVAGRGRRSGTPAGRRASGTGDVLRAVLDAGIRDIALGIGGSRDDRRRRRAAPRRSGRAVGDDLDDRRPRGPRPAARRGAGCGSRAT